MKHYSIFLILSLFSCRSSQYLFNEEFTKIRFKEKFPYGDKTIIQKYVLRVPKGGKITKDRYNFTGDYHTEYRIVYADSSIVYIGNSNLSGSKLNEVNRVESGVKGINKKHENDSLFFSGLQKNGRYWKEIYLGEMIVGYVNVKQEIKEKYEKSIQSLKPIK